MNKPPALVVSADELNRSPESLPAEVVLVVADADGARAAEEAAEAADHRTAVFVGDLCSKAARDAAEEMAQELFNYRT